MAGFSLVQALPHTYSFAQPEAAEVWLVQRNVVNQGRGIRFAGDCVGCVDGRQWGDFRLGRFCGMLVLGYCMHQWKGQPPNAHQVGTYFRVSAAQTLPCHVRART